MRKRSDLIAVLCILLLAFSMAVKTFTVNGENMEAAVVSGEFLIGVREMNETLIASVEKNGFEVVKRIDQINVLVVKARNGVSVGVSIKSLLDSRSIR
ncbi:MAG TPA: hypothetical protein ENG07_00405, partial [Candidatus Bathyarchaeota archaeon]|nr:hypothetical protein [Candidatus Bathyarchaeota archaeon]